MQIFVYSVALKWNLHELVFITHGEIIGGHETKDQRNRDKEASGQHFFLKEIAITFSEIGNGHWEQVVIPIRCYLMNKST